MARLAGSLEKYPARVLFGWYAALIAAGAVLLAQPLCAAPGRAPISGVDAAFTATSATCVTGLVVRSTGNDFSWIGQIVVLGLIQLGGIGIMTVTTFVTFHLGGRQSLRTRAVLAETLGAGTAVDLRWVLGRVILLTFLLEGVGFVCLAARFLAYHPPATALWHALFHSVSAFCNAGFALRDNSLIDYQADPLINPIVMGLIVTGGLGFPVWLDLGRNWHGPWTERWGRLLLHSKIMLVGTVVLLACGTGAVLLLEWDGVLRDMSLPQKLLVSMFHSTTCRTAGFNTVELAGLTNATLFVSMLLMAIGAGPCSTGGGFKVSTFFVLALRGWATFRGHERVNVARRTMPDSVVDRAIAAAVLFGAVGVVALTVLMMAEQSRTPHSASQGLFMDASFEVISALGTVGLSTGLTSDLSIAGRVVIIVLMFIGRLGPISVFAALSLGERRPTLQYAQDEPLIG